MILAMGNSVVPLFTRQTENREEFCAGSPTSIHETYFFWWANSAMVIGMSTNILREGSVLGCFKARALQEDRSARIAVTVFPLNRGIRSWSVPDPGSKARLSVNIGLGIIMFGMG